MLAIQQSKGSVEKCTPNLLPCKINHDGPVNASERYWKPEVGQDGSRTAYFRGRKLEGREIKVPEGYRGAVLRTTDNILPAQQQSSISTQDVEDDDEEDAEAVVETREVEELASFDEVIVWGHEAVPASDDTYSKGLGEWISFADAMHSTTAESADKS